MRSKNLKKFSQFEEECLRYARIHKNLKMIALEETKKQARLYALNSNIERTCNNLAKICELLEEYDFKKNNKDLERYL